MEPLYRIEEQSTTGWSIIDPNLTKLTKEKCQKKYDDLVLEGVNPNYLRVVREE